MGFCGTSYSFMASTIGRRHALIYGEFILNLLIGVGWNSEGFKMLNLVGSILPFTTLLVGPIITMSV
jgi:hypothetical protein